jgi:hypothetical protein
MCLSQNGTLRIISCSVDSLSGGVFGCRSALLCSHSSSIVSIGSGFFRCRKGGFGDDIDLSGHLAAPVP